MSKTPILNSVYAENGLFENALDKRITTTTISMHKVKSESFAYSIVYCLLDRVVHLTSHFETPNAERGASSHRSLTVW